MLVEIRYVPLYGKATTHTLRIDIASDMKQAMCMAAFNTLGYVDNAKKLYDEYLADKEVPVDTDTLFRNNFAMTVHDGLVVVMDRTTLALVEVAEVKEE